MSKQNQRRNCYVIKPHLIGFCSSTITDYARLANKTFTLMEYGTSQSSEARMSDQQEANHPLELAARPAKRRKFYRQPIEDENDPKGLDIADGTPLEHPYVDTPGTTNGPSSDDGVLALEDSHLSIAEILRRRKAAQKRRGGIEFSNASRERENTTHLANDKHSSSIKSAIINEAVDRFAPQTGQVADVDKHM